MPVRTYMQIDPRRDHSFRVPRPDLSAALGTPNACTDCHRDRSPEWAAKSVAGWYGAAGRQGAPHFSEAFQAGREGVAEAIPSLAAIAGDPEQPAIIRATSLELLSGFGPSAASAAVTAAQDDDPLVRASAARGLEVLERERRVAAALALLRDPIRAVRIEAGRILASVPPELLSASARSARDTALAEYEAAQRAQADTPSAQLNLAVLETQRGESDRAIQSYRKALELDPDFFPARANLAVLYGQLGQRADAERLLREGIARDPERGEFHYSLGLLLAENERLAAAAGHLGRAAELLPRRARVHYNHGLSLQRIDRLDEAEPALRRAAELAPGDPEIVYALTVFYLQRGRWRDARQLALQLVELTGGAPEILQLLEQIATQEAAP